MLDFTTLINQFADTHTPSAAKAKAPTSNSKLSCGFLPKTLNAYEQAMKGKGWLPTSCISNMVGTHTSSANLILKRMRAANLVELDDSGTNQAGRRPLYQWRWLS